MPVSDIVSKVSGRRDNYHLPLSQNIPNEIPIIQSAAYAIGKYTCKNTWTCFIRYFYNIVNIILREGFYAKNVEGKLIGILL